MRMADIKPGVVYLYDGSNNWREQSGFRNGSVIFDDVTTQYKSTGSSWNSRFIQIDGGGYLKGRTATRGDGPEFVDFGESREVYVRPATVRATWAEGQAEIAKAREARQKRQRKDQDAGAAAAQRADALRDRLARLGFKTGYEHDAVHVKTTWRTHSVTAEMSEATLTALLDRIAPETH